MGVHLHQEPAYPDLAYVDTLIGPDTVNTLPDETISAFLDHGTVARTIDADLAGADGVMAAWPMPASTWRTSARTLESEGVASFAKSFDELIQALTDKANALNA